MNTQGCSTSGLCPSCKDDQLNNAYASLLVASLKNSFPSFVGNFQLQNGAVAERGRVAMIDFQGQGKTSVTQFTSSCHLKSFLDHEGPVCAPRKPPRRRLCMLEDIARNKVEILGSRLRIPPSVFAAHWTDPSTGDETFDDGCLLSNGPRYFRMKYRQLHRIDGYYPLGLYGDRNANVPRWLQLLDREREFESSEHHFSFWGTEHGLGSWTAILLLDPLITQARLVPDPFSTQLRSFLVRLDHSNNDKGTLPYPQPISTEILPPDPLDWKPGITVGLGSIFDGTLEYYQSAPHSVSEDIRSATFASRRIALCMWRGYLRSREKDFYKLNDKMFHDQSPNQPHGWFHTWGVSWRIEVFRKLTFGKIVTERANASMCSVLHILGINSDSQIMVDQYESADWQALQDRGASLATKFDNLIEGYVQEASIEESRGVGRLTKLATILVPFSITAGMFSMGDDYLVGKPQFWVFWAVVIPLVLLLSIMVFTTFISSFWLWIEKIIWSIQRPPPLFRRDKE